MNRRQNNPGRQQQRRTRVIPQVTALRNDITGCDYVPNSDPRAITELPFNSICLEFTNLNTDGETTSGTVQVSVGSIRTKLKTLVGLTDSANIKLKVQKTSHYVTADGNGFIRPSLRSQVYELNQSGSATARTTLADKGNLNDPAKVGYHWPMVDKKEILTSADDAVLVTACEGGTTKGAQSAVVYPNVLVRLYILWRASGP